MYRIEKRPQHLNEAATLFWNRNDGWRLLAEDATLYTAQERENDPTLPDGGCWVLLNEPETDLVAISEREVIDKMRTWFHLWRDLGGEGYPNDRALSDAECDALAAMALLESREALPDEAKLQQIMKDTESLQPMEIER